MPPGRFFGLPGASGQQLVASDGRQYLRRSTRKYDLIVLDAYTANRYGSGIPYSLVTREFFQLVREHLADHGVFACNVIGSLEPGRSGVIAAVYKTIRTAFPRICLFPVVDSGTVVMIAPVSTEEVTSNELLRRADRLKGPGSAPDSAYRERITRLLTTPPDGTSDALVLTDDFAPVDGLLKTQPSGATLNRQEGETLRKTLTQPTEPKP